MAGKKKDTKSKKKEEPTQQATKGSQVQTRSASRQKKKTYEDQ